MAAEQKLTGYPSVDKPWLKYYKEGAAEAAGKIPCGITVWDFIEKRLIEQGDSVPALEYFGRTISRSQFIENVYLWARVYTARAHENSAIFHIFPDYIANVVSEVNGIRECAVVCIEHPILKNIPVAFVTADSNEPGDEIPQKVTRHCIDVLPEQSVPKAVFCVDELPKNVIGKDDYKKMEQIALCRFFFKYD